MALAVSQRLSAHTSSRAAGPLRRARAARRSVAVCAAADRPVWFPGNPPPSYLDGSLAGDYGFDPLRLGSDPEVLKWFVQAELQNGRWAMLGTAGILFPAIATKVGAADIPQWFDAGKVAVEGQSTGSFATLLVVEFILFHWVETVRYYDFKKPGALSNGQFFGITDGFKGVENGYPGGVFDPFGFSKGPQYKEYKDKEIKNARLAMVSFVGYLVQYAATGKGPIDNLADHLADPFHTTFTSNGVSLPFVNWSGF